ncbi:DeoR/GlpR family DNA-binding transcription regulator [Enterococcus hulanensis]|uniref:DeoR/GlpR family DNA-binding transcription regulator n=1 Tax=Enterococcus hulanensis TaxID=2559929 RepID=A0ABU3F5U2_9ENTE|nr:DeoR/GlpR family DNA-binding transcription regulator [Enterococcus hulanensis]MDT2602489.1 DeoR/GlpR family DNA-binding transcription regulator [Enterococcus hulanensis]MDT2611884.1 DeoR/GlpR family DNA-binding transcription regulator [Enterococcus hulanensis]MDT2619042.1 DeoR/GlpR family DNA-binding transcription regulator [Enterococcus hulanensis]MDT2630561.1 DeoR/GlpR family DNA-binding transcription regulator [Enterococcus hulanensis]MDT2658031.1 DeoR/GlpR family DNA-binding transcripti
MDDQLYAEERKQSIVNIVNEKNRMQVAELADLFKVTGSTIRNDLRELENEGLVTRTHGGVIKRDFQRSVEIVPKSREFTNEKYRIAERAVRLIEENDILAIDTGTSCRAFAERLINSPLKRLTILTYDLEIALLLSEKTNYQVQIIGGAIRNGYPYVSGSSVALGLAGFSVDKVILGTTSFDKNYGYSTPNYETAEMKKCLMNISRIKIVLCESSKINQRSFKQFATPDECDYLITDSHITQEQQTDIAGLNINLLLV